MRLLVLLSVLTESATAFNLGAEAAAARSTCLHFFPASWCSSEGGVAKEAPTTLGAVASATGQPLAPTFSAAELYGRLQKLDKLRQDAASAIEECNFDLERAIHAAGTVSIGANATIAVQPSQLISTELQMTAETAVETPDAPLSMSATAAAARGTAAETAVETLLDAPSSMSASAAAPVGEATEEQTAAPAGSSIEQVAPHGVPLSMSAAAAAPAEEAVVPPPVASFAPLTQVVVPAVDAARVAGLPSLDLSAAPDAAPTAPAPPQTVPVLPQATPAPPQTAPAPPRTAFAPRRTAFKDWAYETALTLSTVPVAPDDPIAMATAAATTTVTMASAAVARHGARGAGHGAAPQRRSMLQAVATQGFTPTTSISSGPSRVSGWAGGSGNSPVGAVGSTRTSGALRSAAYDAADASRSWRESRMSHGAWQEHAPASAAASPSSWTHGAGAPAPAPVPPPATDVEIAARRVSPLPALRHRRRGRGLLSGPLLALLVVSACAVVRPQGPALAPLGLAAFSGLALLAATSRRWLAHAL